jgi:hypothetical protein
MATVHIGAHADPHTAHIVPSSVGGDAGRRGADDALVVVELVEIR